MSEEKRMNGLEALDAMRADKVVISDYGHKYRIRDGKFEVFNATVEGDDWSSVAGFMVHFEKEYRVYSEHEEADSLARELMGDASVLNAIGVEERLVMLRALKAHREKGGK